MIKSRFCLRFGGFLVAYSTAAFIKRLHKKCPIRIQTILTDNGKEFTDRFTAKGEREPTGNHAFDKVCTSFGIGHRLIPPKHPQTNGMVERFNGRISHVVKSTRFANADEMKATLLQYLELYNHHVVQRNLGHLTPVKALKGWYGKKPELFNKRAYDQTVKPLQGKAQRYSPIWVNGSQRGWGCLP